MICENPNCHCHGEISVIVEGRLVCSPQCRPGNSMTGEACHCGHIGCELIGAFAFVEPEMAFA